jgi:hypothetical protein
VKLNLQKNPHFTAFLQYVLGNLNSGKHSQEIANICKVIFAGNIIESDNVKNNIVQFDKEIQHLVDNVSVDVMPGENEPVSNQWPQK